MTAHLLLLPHIDGEPNVHAMVPAKGEKQELRNYAMEH